jgi:hypothetical protein
MNFINIPTILAFEIIKENIDKSVDAGECTKGSRRTFAAWRDKQRE